MISANTIKKVSNDVYRRFPQLSGVKPEVKKHNASAKNGETYLLIFTNRDTKSPDVPITTYVRVVVNESGLILKISTSR